MRDELRAALANGVNARELIALEPLLTEFDGVEIAAAALRLLERDREREKPAEKPEKTDRILAPIAERAAPAERVERADRAPRSDRAAERGDRVNAAIVAPRGERPDRERGARPERGDRDSARSGFSRGAPSRTPASRGEMSRLFVNAGKADGMTPRDLVGSIANESGISSDQIGKIELRDTHSIVEISTPVAEQVAIEDERDHRARKTAHDACRQRQARRAARSAASAESGARVRASSARSVARVPSGARPIAARAAIRLAIERGAPPARGDRPSSGPRRDAPRRDGPPRTRRPS